MTPKTPVLKVILLVELFILVVISQVTLKAQEAGMSATKVSLRTLSDSSRRVVFDAGAFSGPSATLPHWDNGYLVSREVETFEPNVPNVRLYDQSGSLIRQTTIWFSGSVRVLIYSATATPDGRIIAGGKAEKADGTSAPFIALTDLAGKVTNVIQTEGFYPSNICQAPDGTVWSFGGTGFDGQSKPNPGDTLRRFDFQHGQVDSYLPRSTFPQKLHPAPSVSAYIRCSSDAVVAYSSSAQEYIEMKYGDNAPHLYHAEVPSGFRLVGLAATESKKVYGYLYAADKGGGLFYLSFGHSSTAEWLPVEGTVGVYTQPGVVIGLWGSDGKSLVVSHAGDSAGNHALYWTTPID